MTSSKKLLYLHLFIIMDILLVEDNADEAEITIRALNKNNFGDKLLWLRDGVLAIDFLLGRGDFLDRDITILPKVIFLDLKLPKLAGLEVLKEIRKNEATSKIPVVVLTSSEEDSDIFKSYSLGVNSYIVKPVDFENFSKAIEGAASYWIYTNKVPRSIQ